MGIAWASAPVDNNNDCNSNSLSRCVVYYSQVAPGVLVEEASDVPAEYTAYRYLPFIPQTPAPTPVPTPVPTNIPTKTPTKTPTKKPTKVPTDAPTNAPTYSPTNSPTNAPTKAPTNAPTDTPDPLFKNLGSGFCRDSADQFNEETWDTSQSCVDLTTCQTDCKAQDRCVGIAWSLNPSASTDTESRCGDKSLPRCVVYYGVSEIPAVVVEKASGVPEEYTAYRYLPFVPKTPAPTDAPTDIPDPLFKNLESGFCRDSADQYNEETWVINQSCVDLTTCQTECKAQDRCVGVAWSLNPSAGTDTESGCGAKSLPRCVVYYGVSVTPTVVVEKASGVPEEYTAYRYLPFVPQTPAPMNDPKPTPAPSVFDEIDVDTPVPTMSPINKCPKDSKDIVYKTNTTCKKLKEKSKKKIKKICKKESVLGNNARVYDSCPKTCGKKAGLGPCSYLK